MPGLPSGEVSIRLREMITIEIYFAEGVHKQEVDCVCKKAVYEVTVEMGTNKGRKSVRCPYCNELIKLVLIPANKRVEYAG